MATNMTYDENYGSLPKATLRLIKRYNVSPADYDVMLDILGLAAWDSEKSRAIWSVIDIHILDNVVRGYYYPRFF